MKRCWWLKGSPWGPQWPGRSGDSVGSQSQLDGRGEAQRLPEGLQGAEGIGKADRRGGRLRGSGMAG